MRDERDLQELRKLQADVQGVSVRKDREEDQDEGHL